MYLLYFIVSLKCFTDMVTTNRKGLKQHKRATLFGKLSAKKNNLVILCYFRDGAPLASHFARGKCIMPAQLQNLQQQKTNQLKSSPVFPNHLHPLSLSMAVKCWLFALSPKQGTNVLLWINRMIQGLQVLGSPFPRCRCQLVHRRRHVAVPHFWNERDSFGDIYIYIYIRE